MTAAEILRREEQLLLRSRYRNWIAIACTTLVVLGGTFYAGVRYGRPGEQPTDLRKPLKDVTDSLRIVRSRFDSTHRADSVATAAVVAARTRIAIAAKAIHVSPNTSDPVITVDRPATTDAISDTVRTTVVVDTITSLPLATYVRETKIQLHADSVAFAVKDARIADLVHADSLAQRQDSLHVATEHALEAQVRTAHRRGFVTGAKVGSVLTAAAILAAKILIH